MTYHETISLDIEYEIYTDKWGNAYPMVTEIDGTPVPDDNSFEWSKVAKLAIYERLWEDTDLQTNIDDVKAGMKDRSVIDKED